MEQHRHDDLSPAIRASFENGNRLLDDSQNLLEYGRFPTAYALSILAQEEYAKTFFLYLVQTGAIPWNADIRRVLRDHTCKQLLATIMEYVKFEWEVDMAKIRLRVASKFPAHIADALNIIRHEKVPREDASSWLWDDESPCDKQARGVADGIIDKQKQNALYVGLAKTGQISSTPLAITEKEAKIEYEKGDRLREIFHKTGENIEPLETIEYKKISDAFKILFSVHDS